MRKTFPALGPNSSYYRTTLIATSVPSPSEPVQRGHLRNFVDFHAYSGRRALDQQYDHAFCANNCFVSIFAPTSPKW
jgi:hypothetical protein